MLVLPEEVNGTIRTGIAQAWSHTFCYNNSVERCFMERWTGLILPCLLLAGCARKEAEPASLVKYRSYYTAISESTEYIEESASYSLELEMTALDKGGFSYYIVVDEPRVSMYDVVVMAVEDDIPYVSSAGMMPSIGIFDGPYTMIPNQVNREDGFVKGVIASGVADSDPVSLKILVEWKDRYKENTYRDFYHVQLSCDGIVSETGGAAAE